MGLNWFINSKRLTKFKGSYFACIFRMTDIPVHSLGQIIIASVLNSLRSGVIVIVTCIKVPLTFEISRGSEEFTSLLSIQSPAVAVLHPQVEVRVPGYEHREDGERRGDLVELQPVVDILHYAG